MRQRAALILLLVGYAATPAGAFVPKMLENSSAGIPPQMMRWPEGTRSIPFRTNRIDLELMSNLISDTDPTAALEASAKAWEVAPIALTLAGLSNVTSVGRDGINLITFADTPENRDRVADHLAVTTTYWQRFGTSSVRFVEADIVFTATSALATDGDQSSFDIQSICTHEMGHVLGLSHSPLHSATMWPYIPREASLQRSLERDEIAGVRAIYGVPTPGTGTIAGWVVTEAGDGVFGAHVVATDASGVVQVGALSTREGRFTIPALPPGDYQLYAEPLNGAFTPKNLGDDFYHDGNNPLLTSFRSAFVEAGISVKAEAATRVAPIEVQEEEPSFTPRALRWSTDWVQWHQDVSAPISPGGEIYLAVYGPGVRSVPRDGWSISGTDVSIDASTIVYGKPSTGDPYAVLPLSARSAAPPGARSVYLTRGTERAVLTACLQVVEP